MRSTHRHDWLKKACQRQRGGWYPFVMTVKDILREIEALPSEQRLSLLEGLRRLVEPEIPASFKKWIVGSASK